MKKLFLLLLCLPLFLNAQDEKPPTLVFHNVLLTAEKGKMKEFRSAMANHNKTFHSSAEHGCRVYYIMSGPDIGKYIWTMGPTTWENMDSRPGKGDHDADWEKVVATMENHAFGTYWTFDRENSHFGSDFNINMLEVLYVDIERGRWKDIGYMLGQIKDFYESEFPEDNYGIYWNETSSTKDGRDLAVIWFHDSWTKRSEDNDWVKKWNAKHGEGGWDRWMKSWIDATEGSETEFWKLQPDLSGLPAAVKASARQ